MSTSTFLKERYKSLLIYVIKYFIRTITKNFLPNKSLKTVLILAPHPDDEILGLGGIIMQTLQKDGKVHLVYLTDGEGSRVWPDLEEIKRQRLALTDQVCEKLGINLSSITRLHLPDGAVPYPGKPGFEEAVKSIRQLIEGLKPDAVFATHTLDYWPYDHVACAHIAKEAVKQSAHKTQLWYYWVWTWYNLRPWQLFKLNYGKIFRIDITEQLAQKNELSDIYLNSLTPNGKPWSGVLPKALVKALSQPFEVIEKIEVNQNEII